MISIIQLSNEQLASCSWDRSIKIWSMPDGHCEYTINDAHRNRIRKIILLSNRRMASCGDDNEINIWSIDSPFQLIVSISHERNINSIMQLKGKEKLVAGENSRLIIWNLLSYKKETIINNICCYWIDSLFETNSGKLIIGGKKEINILNSSTYILIKKMKNVMKKNGLKNR